MESYENIVRTRKPRVKIKTAGLCDENVILMEDYYMTKRPDLDALLDFNPHVVGTPGQFLPQMRALIRLCQSQTERMAIHGDKLVPFD